MTLLLFFKKLLLSFLKAAHNNSEFCLLLRAEIKDVHHQIWFPLFFIILTLGQWFNKLTKVVLNLLSSSRSWTFSSLASACCATGNVAYCHHVTSTVASWVFRWKYIIWKTLTPSQVHTIHKLGQCVDTFQYFSPIMMPWFFLLRFLKVGMCIYMYIK